MRVVFRIVVFLLMAGALHAQRAPLCDIDCSPYTPPGTTGGANPPQGVTPRAQGSSQRGFGAVSSATVQAGGAAAVQGSQSYTYNVPLFSVPGRAGFDLNLNLYYNSHIWTATPGGMTIGIDRDTPSPGFQVNFGFLEWNPGSNFPAGIITTPDGAKHTLAILWSNLVQDPTTGLSSCINQVCQYVSDDSSYYFVSRPLGTKSGLPCTGPSNCAAPDVTIIDKSGKIYLYESFAVATNDIFDEFVMRPYKIQDSNGNYMTISYVDTNSLNISSVTDTLGRAINFVYDSGGLLQCITNGAATCATVPGPLGVMPIGPGREFTFNWDPAHAVNFNFAGAQALLGPTLFNITSPFTTPVLTSVCRPDSTCAKFNYGDWGIVNDIQELSSDGTVRYELKYNFPLASAGQLTTNPAYTQQTEIVNGQSSVWTYGIVNDVNGLIASSSISDPAGLTTTTSFSRNGDWQDGLPIQIQMVDTNGFHIQNVCVPTPCPTPSFLTRKLTWTSDPSPSFPPGSAPQAVNRVNPHPSNVVTVLEDGSQKQLSMTYDVASGNVADLKESDLGAGAPGPLLRETVTTYKVLGNHILGLPTDVLVKDGNGKVFSHTAMAYDGAAVQSVSATITGHDDVGYSAGSLAPRGNLTSVTSYPDPTSATGGIANTFVYDMAGNKVSQTKGCCATTTQTFSAATVYAYPDSIVQDPLGPTPLTTSFTYTGTGAIASRKDWNNQVTQYGYDLSGRPTSVTTPDNVTTTTQYDDAGANPAIRVFNSVNPSSVVVHTSDFLGRTVSDQLLSGTTAVSTRSYVNDFRGRPLQISNPYGPGETPVYAINTYDLLGRLTSTTPPAVTAGIAQKPYLNSFQGGVKTVTDPAGQQQRQFVNGLGQLVEVDEPGPTGGAFATGSVAISGTELSVPSTSTANGATAGTASVTIGGTADRTTTVVTHNATPATATLTVGGTNGINVNSSTLCTGGPPSRLPLNCKTFTNNQADSGTMRFSVNVGGTVITSASVSYPGPGTAAGLAANLAAAFPANALVTLSYGGGTSLTLTTTGTGVAANSAVLTPSLVSNCVPTSTDTSSTTCNQGWTLGAMAFTGGTDTVTALDSDTGRVTVSITANGTTYTKQSAYTGGSSPGSIALDLFNQFNSDVAFSQVVRVTQPGTGGVAANGVGFTTVATGANTGYGLSVSSATSDANFAVASTSFPVSASGSSFSPGVNGVLFDSGTVLLKVNGFTTSTAPSKQVSYGQGSNAPGIAAQLVSLIHNDPLFPVDASVPAGSATISFTARAQGAAGNSYVVSITGTSALASSFPTPSFAAPALQATLANGAEPSFSLDGGAAFVTTYNNDPRGMVLQIVRGLQTQSFGYDGLARLTSVATPELGGQSIQYTYTDFGAVRTRIDPRVLPGATTHLTTTYSYDTLDRLTGISYNDGVTPNATFSFAAPLAANNTGGRLSGMSSAVESKTYKYDPMGRILQCLETIGSNSYTVGYSYAPDGSLKSITYPSQKVVNFSYDSLDRLTQVMLGATQPILSINSGDYNAVGQPLAVTYGNNIKRSVSYNAQMQLSSLQYGGAAPAAPLLSLGYLYGDGLDNGQITGITDKLIPERSAAYQYDPLGRLVMAQTTDLSKPDTWKLSFAYDRYNNRLAQLPEGGAGSMFANLVSVDPATNHISGSGVSYDAAGNMVSDGMNNFVFDSNNRVVSTSPVPGLGGAAANFAYGPDGQRVNNNGTYFIYSGGQPIAEYANGAPAASPGAEYINVGSQVATIVGGAISFNFTDHLSNRVIANSAGAAVGSLGQFPFGELWYQTGTAGKWDFTTYERDISSSGLDYANARFYSSRLGRFTSPDQVLGSNRYAYVNNDPINLTDPTGRDPQNCTTNPFELSRRPLCGPDQLGGGNGTACGFNFSDAGVTLVVTSNCSSFGVNFSESGGLPFGSLEDSLRNILALTVNIDTCPPGGFECPTDGRPLFGTPKCDPRFCVLDSSPSKEEIENDKRIFDLTSRYVDPDVIAHCLAAVSMAEINELAYFNLLLDGYFGARDLTSAIGKRKLKDYYEPKPSVVRKGVEGIAKPEEMRAENNRRIDQLLGEANASLKIQPCNLGPQAVVH